MHIGLPKTGTSALQVYFAKNRDALLVQAVDYLPIGQFDLGTKGHITSGNAAQLARSLAPGDSPLAITNRDMHIKEFFDAIDRSTAETCLISSEILSGISDTVLNQFAKQVQAKGIEVRLLFYVRSQVQLLVSGYIQHVKRAACTELPDEFVRRAYTKDRRWRYWSYLQRLNELFGAENVICRVYETARSGPGGLSGDFLRAIGKDPIAVAQVLDEVNNSIPPSDLAIMLLLNRYSPNTAFCDMVIENARISGTARVGTVHRLISTVLSREISNYFADENRALAANYFGREKLFPDQDDDETCDFVSPENLSSKDVVSFMSGIVVRFHSRIANLERKLLASTHETCARRDLKRRDNE